MNTFDYEFSLHGQTPEVAQMQVVRTNCTLFEKLFELKIMSFYFYLIKLYIFRIH